MRGQGLGWAPGGGRREGRETHIEGLPGSPVPWGGAGDPQAARLAHAGPDTYPDASVTVTKNVVPRAEAGREDYPWPD